MTDAQFERLMGVVTEMRDAMKSAPLPAHTPQAGRGASGGLCFGNFGRSKGKPIAGASMDDLNWYLAACERSLGDPAKSRFHDNEQRIKSAIVAEIARQGGGGSGPASANGAPPDFGCAGGDLDDVPFAWNESERVR